MKKHRELIKRLVSLFMAFMMTFTCLPLEVFAEEIGEERNAWSGRSAVFVGDSITAGAGVTKKYYQHLAEALDLDSFTAMGVGGSCISAASDYGQNNQPLINRYQNIPSVDLIMIFMGTNDYGHETPLGTVEDTQEGTFYGALNAIVPALVAKHTSSKIVFVTPIHRYGFGTSKILGTNFTYDSLPNGVGATLEDYVKAIKAVCTNNDVDVIDLYTECTLDPTDSTVRSTYMPDGLHPNDAGHAYIAEIMAAHIAGYEPVEKESLTLSEMIQGNKFASGNNQPCRASSRINYYLEEGTVITLKDPAAMQWACAKTSNENSSNNLGYFPDSQWTDKETAVVAEDGWIGFTFKYRDETRSFDLTKPLSDYITIEAPHTHNYKTTVTAPTCTEQGFTTHACECGDSYVDSYVDAKGHTYNSGICTVCGEKSPALEGKTISILGASISTFAGISNGIAADTTNSTIRNNAKYYPHDVVTDVELTDTWWMQVANDLGLRLLVNNSWSGSSLLHERNGTVGAYVNRCVQLHDDTGDNAGEMPDIIGIQMGTNDFQYYKDTLGTANINYAALITENEDGSYTYATPVTSLEAAAIVLHKISVRYPDAEVYYLNISQRVDDTDELIQSFNGELKKVVEHFGAHIVDIYGSAITMDDFDTYIGDGRVHPNKLGMDVYTEAFKKALVENTAYTVDTHTVSLNLDGVTADYGDNKIVVDGSSYTVKLSVAAKMDLDVTVAMGGKDVTASAYANGIVTLDSVTADVTITAKAVYEPKEYRWTFNGTDLACVSGSNALTKLSGSTTNGVFSKTSYALADEVVLLHNLPWVVEWKCEGTFLNTGGSSGARVLTSDSVNANYDARYIFKSNTNGLIAMGEKTTSGSHNYGIALANYDIDWTKLHTYRLENRIASDGSNMVWLSVDGVEIGALNNYYVGTTNKNTTSNRLSGKDFVFPYMGTDTHGFTNASIDHIAVWEGGHTHNYKATITAPTCTEQGLTTHACECGDSYVDSYVDAKGHTYNSGICTVCNTEHPQLANYNGKVISVLGDSISTFAGYIPVADGFNLEHLPRYPQDNLLTDVNETWWMQVISELDGKLGINDSWRGATVSGDKPVTTGTTGENAAMCNLTRIQNLGANGTPDVILFYGGTNDLAHVAKVGSFDPSSAPTVVDLATKKWDNLADGYVHTLLRLRHYYPDAQIMAMLPTYTTSYYSNDKLAQGNAVLAQICEHYGVPYVDLRECGITTADLPDGIHPDANGMDNISKAVIDTLLNKCEVQSGENVVHSVKHNLVGAESSLGYYKGVTAGKAFVTTISGEELTVSVTMGGADITNTAYANGVVTIAEVTDDIAITATGRVKTIYEDYLQQLPEKICSATNLWAILEHDAEYYTVNGWGVHSSGTVSSITIPVSEGDRITATSFGAAGKNGGSLNGIRVTWFSESGVLKTVGADAVYEEFSKNAYLTAPTGAVAVSIPMWKIDNANEVYLLNYEHSYTSGICTVCGAEGPGKTESLPLRYDDHYDVTDKSVEIIDAGIPTSYQVGHGVEENKVMDTAVVTLRDNALVATGTGTAKVKIDGILYEVTVEAAPISLLLLIGQSNMRGSEGNANQSIVCPDGMVYATFGDDRGDTEGIMNVNNATKFAASALTGQYSTINVEGTTEHLSYYPINSLTEAGKGTFGPDSGFAYEWVKQTGEKVWVVNAAHGGSAISSWQPNATNFKEAVLLFSACQETLRKEIAAGHFTLSHMGYFWCQGCSDATMTAQQYVKKYLTMHDGLNPALTFDHDSNSSTPDVGFEFAGIIPVRAAHDYFISYREGVYTDTTTASYYESFKDLRFNGPRVAQYWMANNPDLPDIWNVCNIGEDWVWMPDGTNGVTEYFQSHYEDGTVDYTTQVKQAASWYTPTTPKAVHDSIHYNQIGYNEIGRESARNALIMLGEIEAPNVETEVKFLGWDGYSEVTMMDAYTEGRSETLVVPKVYPVWKSKEVTYTLTDGLVWDYYDLLMENDSIGGMLAAEGMSDTVTITGHTWSEWVTLSEPSVEGPGQQ